jgi:hypothetical protein
LLYPKIKPTEYLSFAKGLSSQIETAAKRSAADRAYFASYLACRENLFEKGYIVPYGGPEDHEYVSRTLRTVFGSKGNDEFRLRRARNEITYNIKDLFAGQNNAAALDWMLDTATELISSVERLSKNPRGPIK